MDDSVQCLHRLGHHRASCSRAGVLGRRGFALESAVVRVCREAGARVSANVFLRDLDLPIGAMDQRRIEVIAEGLLVFHGAQLAIDATLVSPLRADGEPHRRCPEEDGAALAFARRHKERTQLELAGGRGRARLVVIAAETGGRFSEETQTLLRLLAEAETRSTPQPLRVRARQSGLVLLLGHLHLPCWVKTATCAPMVTRLLSLTCGDFDDCAFVWCAL